MSDSMNRCEWVLEHIEPYLDGDLEPAASDAFKAHCSGCAGCARELSLAIRVRRELRALPGFDAPPAVIARSAHELQQDHNRVTPLPARRRLRVRVVAPVAAAAALAVVAALLWTGALRRSHAGYTEAEIAQARAGIALAFGYVDRYSDGVVREDVLDRRVMPRIERALRGPDVTSPPPGRS